MDLLPTIPHQVPYYFNLISHLYTQLRLFCRTNPKRSAILFLLDLSTFLYPFYILS